MPETIAWDAQRGCIVGYRRNKCFSLSNDYGENWTRIEPDVPFDFLYQPYLLALDGGRLWPVWPCGRRQRFWRE